MSLGPFDLTGGPFLQLYGTLFAIAIAAGFVIPRWLRPEGRPGRITGTDDLAYLAGGVTRFADALMTRLLAAGAVILTGGKLFSVQNRDYGTSAAERSVLALPPPIGWPVIEKTLKPYGEPVERRLVGSGLLIDRSLAMQMRFWQTLPYFLLLPFGAIKWVIGDARGKPVGYLTALLVVTTIFAIIRWVAVDRRTRNGIEALKDAQARSDRLRRAPTSNEADMAVALFGTAVLVGSGWSDFHTLRNASSGDGGSGGSSDGGCGGGGCGGCGG